MAKRIIKVLFGFRIDEMIDAKGDKKKTSEFLKKVQIEKLRSAFYAAVEDSYTLLEHTNRASAGNIKSGIRVLVFGVGLKCVFPRFGIRVKNFLVVVAVSCFVFHGPHCRSL